MTSGSSSSSPSSKFRESSIETVAKALRVQHDAYLEALRTEGLGPLQERLGQVLEAHDEARAHLPTESVGRHDLWTGLRRYRAASMDAVWRPLRTRLEELDLGTLLRDRDAALREGRDRLADEGGKAADLSVSSSSSSGLEEGTRWTSDWIVRGWEGVRGLLGLSGMAMEPISPAVLVGQHAPAVAAEVQAAPLEAAEQRMMGWIARLEREASAWTHRLLELERVLDRPAFHDATSSEPPEPRPGTDPTSGVMAPDLEAVQAELEERSASLHRCLRDGRALSLDDVREAFEEAVQTAVTRLRAVGEREGRSSGTPPRAVRTAERRRRERLDRWPDWVDEGLQRLAFLDILVTFRDDLTSQHRALVNDLFEAGISPARGAIRETAQQLGPLRDKLEALLADPSPDEDWELSQAFDQNVEDGTHLLEDHLLAPVRALTPRRAARTVLDSHVETLAALIDAQPDGFVVHALSEPGTSLLEPTEAYTLQWRDECRDVLDELLVDAWRTALSPMLATAESLGDRVEEVRTIVQFNLGAALQDVRDLQEADGDRDSLIENARELALDGLDRALGVLEAEDDTMRGTAGRLLYQTWVVTSERWTDLHDQMRAAGHTRAHVLRLRGQMVRGTHWLAVEGGRRVRATTTQLKRILYRVQRQARRLVHLGHAAVGTTPVDEAAIRETVDTLSTIDVVLADLPLVYRRLFSFRAIQNPDLLVARDADRAAVERHAERWKGGLTNTLVLIGPAGSGRTSLLNVLRKTTFSSTEWHTLELTDRIDSEAEFAEQVVRALGLPVELEGECPLDTVAEHLRAQPVSDQLRVCVIEQLEHVFRRSVGGTALVARILNFLSETDTRILWIATTTNVAWQVVEASEPAAARLVTTYVLDPFDRAELEKLIMTRHRRSGLRLAFEIPDEATHPILSRRARALDDEDRRQSLLRSEFFDHLYEVCGQNVMLALFYWFRSVTLDADEATLRVRALRPVSFDVLDTLPLPYAFTLKALLEHGTLTVDELADVLGVSTATSRSLLETLGNALVIAPADRVEGPGVFQFASVDRDTRYRIRPLLVHPATRFLRSRNIVH